MAYITWDPPSIGRLIQFHVGFQQQKLPCHLSKNGSFFFMISARDVPQICNFNNFMKQNKPQYPSISIPCLIRFPRKFPRKLDLSDHQLRSDEIRSLGPAGPLGPSPASAPMARPGCLRTAEAMETVQTTAVTWDSIEAILCQGIRWRRGPWPMAIP